MLRRWLALCSRLSSRQVGSSAAHERVEAVELLKYLSHNSEPSLDPGHQQPAVDFMRQVEVASLSGLPAG